MKLTLLRRASFGGATIGKLYVDGVFACHTLEDEVREVEGQPVAVWKIKDKTAIPKGTYVVTLETSARFGPETLSLANVPGFSYIRMHAGNTAADTEGCILLGMQAGVNTLIGGTSRPARDLIKGYVRKALARGEKVTIDIGSAATVA